MQLSRGGVAWLSSSSGEIARARSVLKALTPGGVAAGGGRWPLSIPAGFLQNYLYTTMKPAVIETKRFAVTCVSVLSSAEMDSEPQFAKGDRQGD